MYPFFYSEEIIDLSQEFLPPKKSSIHCVIYRFKIHRLTPNSLFPPENIDYYSIKGISEEALLGVKWEEINGKVTPVEKQISVQLGDTEMLEYVSNELQKILKKQISEQFSDKIYLVDPALC